MDRKNRTQLNRYENFISEMQSSWLKYSPPMSLADYVKLYFEYEEFNIRRRL